MLLIKNAFAVLTFLMLSISSAQADYLTDLCDDLYAKIEDPSTGSYITKKFFSNRVMPEVVSVVEAEIAAEVDEFFTTGAGKSVRSSRMSKERKFDFYLQHEASIKKAKKGAWAPIRKFKRDEDGNIVTVEKVYPKPGVKVVPGVLDDPNNLVVVQEPIVESRIPEMTEGEKLRALFVAHYRYSRQQTAVNAVAENSQTVKDEYKQYQNQLFNFVFPNIINSFTLGNGILGYIYN